MSEPAEKPHDWILRNLGEFVERCFAQPGVHLKITMRKSFVDDPPVKHTDGFFYKCQHAGPQIKVEMVLTDTTNHEELSKARYYLDDDYEKGIKVEEGDI